MTQPFHAQALSTSAKDDRPAAVMAPTSFLATLKTDKADVAEPQTKEESVSQLPPAPPVPPVPPVPPEPPKPVEHIVQPGESLSTIGARYQITWKRLYDKNTAVANPDVINVNERLVIPTAEEVLPERDVPVAIPAAAPQSTYVTAAVAKPKAATYTAGSSAGNTYSRGYCTWYAKNRRPDLPNNLGNAITWTSRAAAQGLATGTTPRVGAIGQSGNHVVFVESVNGDGTITVSEMNWKGLGIISSRTASASGFSYIY